MKKEHKVVLASLVIGSFSFAMFWFAFSGITAGVSHITRLPNIECTPDSIANVITEDVPISPTLKFTVEKAFYINGLCEGIVSVMGHYQPVYIGEADNGKPYLITGVMWQDKRNVSQNLIEKLKTKKGKAVGSFNLEQLKHIVAEF